MKSLQIHLLSLLLLVFLSMGSLSHAQAGSIGITDKDFTDPSTTQTTGSITAGAEEDLSHQIMKMLGALAFVLATIAVAFWLFRKFVPQGKSRSPRSDAIRIISTKLLGGRRSLMLIRVRGQTLLLGVTPQSINCLTEVQEVEGEWAQPGGAPSSSFEKELTRQSPKETPTDF
jgi:flagellar biosynthetic protein FliO